jgi:hypothetical protein
MPLLRLGLGWMIAKPEGFHLFAGGAPLLSYELAS